MHKEDTTPPPEGQDGAHVAPVKPYDRTRAILSSRLPGTPRTVLLAIADHLSAPDGWCWPSVDRLAELSGRSTSAVRRALRLLQSGSVLEVEEVRGRSSRYRVCWTALAAFGVCDSTHPSHFDTPVILTGAPVILQGAPVKMTAEADQEADQEADHIHTPQPDPSGGTPDGVECGPVENPVDNHSTPETSSLEAGPAPGTGDTPQQTLIPTEGSAAAPPPADPAAALWTSLEAVRREIDPAAKPWKLTASRRKSITARLREHTADEIRAVWRWWLTSPHSRATYLRDHGYTAETILRPGNLGTYVEMAGQSRQTTLTGADAWEEVLEALAYWQAQPPWVRWGDVEAWAFADDEDPQIHARYAGGLKAAGGTNDVLTAWRNLYRAASDYDRRQQRSAFCAAWTRSGLREVA